MLTDRRYQDVMNQIINERAEERAQVIIDESRGYISGRVIVDGHDVMIQVEGRPDNYELIKVFPEETIEIENRGKYHSISEADAVHTMSSDGWPLYAGCLGRIKR